MVAAEHRTQSLAQIEYQHRVRQLGNDAVVHAESRAARCRTQQVGKRSAAPLQINVYGNRPGNISGHSLPRQKFLDADVAAVDFYGRGCRLILPIQYQAAHEIALGNAKVEGLQRQNAVLEPGRYLQALECRKCNGLQFLQLQADFGIQ